LASFLGIGPALQRCSELKGVCNDYVKVIRLQIVEKIKDTLTGRSSSIPRKLRLGVLCHFITQKKLIILVKKLNLEIIYNLVTSEVKKLISI
jgi:hypothetical protein